MNAYEKEMMELYKKSLGEKTEFHGIICPGTKKKPCRLCDLCKEVLFNKSIPKDAPLRKRASSLNAKQHYFSNILYLADPSQVAVLEYGDKIFKQLLAMQMNPEQGFQDFWHPIAGRWLIIERIQGATKEQVDYYVKPKDPTKLNDMSVLSQMYDLSRITDLIKENKVKVVYQSKLEKTVIIRILPSWLGPEFALKFFEKVDYHYNISEEDFAACLAGEINPVRIDGGDQGVIRDMGVGEKMVLDTAAHGGWGTITPPEQSTQPAPVREVSKWEKEYALPAKEDKAAKEDDSSEKSTLDDLDDLPACYGDFNPTDPDCTTKACPDWADGCRAYREEKLAKRRAAKRLSK